MASPLRTVPERFRFDPAAHVEQLLGIVRVLEAGNGSPKQVLRDALSRYPRGGTGYFSKHEVLHGARYLAEQGLWSGNYRSLVERIQSKPVRTQSGVTPVTVLTQPWPCPGRCVFCPNDPDMPKSYLSKEPGAQRALRHRFDPFDQTTARLTALDQMGHSTNKIEQIILGGTWSSYPRKYQLWFILRLFEALNAFRPTLSGSGARTATRAPLPLDPSLSGFDEPWRLFSRAHLEQRLLTAHQQNETAHSRSVGLTVETRPDHVTEQEVVRLRELGITRVQLGYQSLSDRVLELNKRGHTLKESEAATCLLRRGGFKVQAHWMANLYGSTPELDLEDFHQLFTNDNLHPDELKVYPCMLVEDTALEEHYRAGRWRPYKKKEQVDLLAQCLDKVPPSCRVNRVMRDIPGQDLIDGERLNGLRAEVEQAVQTSELSDNNIRAREVQRATVSKEELTLTSYEYRTTTSRELFLQFVTPDDTLAGFLRLSLPALPAFISELDGSALIREVHVYGTTVPVGERHAGRSQHAGLGTRLVRRAQTLAAAAGFRRLSVISAVGTRNYYRSLGFEEDKLYQHQSLASKTQ